MELASKHTSRLREIKEKVETAYTYFRKNADRYTEFMRFVFSTSLTNEDITKLQVLNKPTLEFNVIESMLNRLCGEFAKHEPGIKVRASDSVRIQDLNKEFIDMIGVIESHLREILNNTANDGLQYNVYRDITAGGYSVLEVFTDYINDMSFDQKILVQRVFDPTLTGFDPLARESHKGDGGFCFQLYPRTKAEFELEFGPDASEGMMFARGLGGFNWSYMNEQEDVLLICDFFEKVKKKTKIVKLSTGHVVTKAHFKELLEEWNKRGFIEQPPIIIEERMTELVSIDRIQLCETKILSHTSTNFKYLPLIFVDGNSVEIRDSDNSSSSQMTRPYAYQAKGIQKLKNFAGQTVAAEIENMVMHKWKVSVESVPDDYKDAYRNVQQQDVLLYNAFLDGNPNVPLTPPMEIQRTPTPPIVESTFLGSDRVTQAILGSYEGALGTNDQDVSGKAVTQGAIFSSAASTPYLVNYIKGLNRICQVVVDLIPKYYVTPRSIPIMTMDGKRSYKIINNPKHPESVRVGYNSNQLNVEVEAGVNTAIQKQVALDQIIKMMQASPLFAQFINTMGLEIILDNLDIRNIETLKVMAAQFMQGLQKQQQEKAGKPTPEEQTAQANIGLVMVEHEKVEQKARESEGKLAIEAAKVAVEKQKIDAQILQILNDIEVKNAKVGIDQERIDSENARTAVETAIDLAKHHGERENKQREKVESD